MGVRTITNEDIPQLVRLVHAFHAKVRPPYTIQEAMAVMTEGLRAGHHLVLVYEDEKGELVGYAWAYPESQTSVFVAQVYGDEKIVDELLEYSRNKLIDAGYTTLRTIALRNGWVRFTKKWGFEPVGVVMEARLPVRPLRNLPDLSD